MKKDGKMASLVQSTAQIANAFDRLVRLAEDWSDTLGLPKFEDPPPLPKKKKPRKKNRKVKK